MDGMDKGNWLLKQGILKIPVVLTIFFAYYQNSGTKLGPRPLDGRGFFVIKGVSWMMFYVLLPIGIGSIRFFHCLTLDLQAEVEKLAFRLGKTSTFGVFTKSETNWIWHVFIPWTSNSTVGRFLFVTATFRVLPRTSADLGCPRYNASTTWRHVSTGKRNAVA